jgi:hypothetical protein
MISVKRINSKPEGKTTLRRLRHRLEDNIEADL